MTRHRSSYPGRYLSGDAHDLLTTNVGRIKRRNAERAQLKAQRDALDAQIAAIDEQNARDMHWITITFDEEAAEQHRQVILDAGRAA